LNAAVLSPLLPMLLALGFALLACVALALAGERVQRALFRGAMAPAARRLLRSAALVCLAGAWLGGGWAAAGEPLLGLLRRMPAPPLILLGEVHDNAQQHAPAGFRGLAGERRPPSPADGAVRPRAPGRH
jgi:hypothetical protein